MAELRDQFSNSNPGVRCQPFLRQVAAFVVHLTRAVHPVAQIDVGKAHPLGTLDVVEDHEGAERALALVWIEERIDHREAVVQHVGERDGQQRPGAAAVDGAIGTTQAVLDQPRLHVAVLDHHGVVEDRHIGHAAVAVPAVEIAAEHCVLLGGRHQRAHLADHVGIAFGNAAHASGRAKLIGDDTDRNASPARFAGRPIGDRLTAPEAAVGEEVVQARRAIADQMGEHLALLLARQIGAGRRRGQVELRRVARMLGHGTLSAVQREPA